MGVYRQASRTRPHPGVRTLTWRQPGPQPGYPNWTVQGVSFSGGGYSLQQGASPPVRVGDTFLATNTVPGGYVSQINSDGTLNIFAGGDISRQKVQFLLYRRITGTLEGPGTAWINERAPVWSRPVILKAVINQAIVPIDLVAQGYVSSPSGDTLTFALASNAMPNGISLSSAGVISGAPTGLGTFVFAISATDASATSTASFASSIAVTQAINVEFIPLPPSIISASGNGVIYTGTVPGPNWASIPNFINQTGALSINLTSFTAAGCTYVLTPGVTLPTGWTFDGVHTISYNGTSVNVGNANISVDATLAATGSKSTSNIFQVQGAGSGSTDTTAPTVALNVAVAGIGTTGATVSWNQSCDNSPPGTTPTNLGNYVVHVKTGGSDIAGSPFSVAPGGTQVLPTWTLTDVGPQTSSITQTGNDLAITTTAVDPSFPATSALGGGAFQLTSTGWIFSAEIDAFTSSGAFDNLRLEARASLATNAPYVAIQVTPTNQSSPMVECDYRASGGGNAVSLASVSNPGLPIRLFMQYVSSSNTYTLSYSNSGNAPIGLGSVVVAMGSTLYLFAAGNRASGTSVSGTIKQLCVSTLPQTSLTLSGLTPGTTYSVTVIAQDQIANVSAASAAVGFTTSASSASNLAGQLGAYYIGGQGSYGTSAFITNQSFCKLIVFGTWDGFGANGGAGTSPASICAAIKAASPANIGTLIAGYFNPYEISTAVGPSNSVLQAAASAGKWYLYLNYLNAPSGTQADVFGNVVDLAPGGNAITTGTPPVARDWLKFCPDFFFDYAVNGDAGGLAINSNVANPNIDGLYLDGGFSLSQISGDYNRNGTSIGPGDSASSLLTRQGYVAMTNRSIANFTGIGRSAIIAAVNLSGIGLDTVVRPEYVGLWNAGVGENSMGEAFSVEFFSTFTAFLAQQQLMSSALGAPGYYIFNQTNLSTSGAAPTSFSGNTPATWGPSWAGFRYGFCSCNVFTVAQTPLYWGTTSGVVNGDSASGAGRFWGDEMSINISTLTPFAYPNSVGPGIGWAGAFIDPPASAPLSDGSGCYGRRTQNASGQTFLWLVNPKGNSPTALVKTQMLYGKNAQALSGIQDPVANPGGLPTSGVQFAHASDGRIVQLV